MNLLKTNLLLSLFLFSQLCFATICVNTSSNYKMFGSSLRSGALARGHELAFQEKHFADYKQFSADTDVELAKQLEIMASGSCSIVLGLFTSRDCLIAGPIFKRNKLIGISSSCGHNDIQNFSPYLYTIIPPLSQFTDVIINYLNANSANKKIFVIYQPTDIYSNTAYQDFKIKFKQAFFEIPITYDGSLSTDLLANYRTIPKIIVFFTYPLPSARALMTLSDAHIINNKTWIIGASSWTFDMSVFRPIHSILEKAKDVLATDILNWGKIKNSSFSRDFLNKYHRAPQTIEILTYDVTTLAIDCYRKSFNENQYQQDLFQKCMIKHPHPGIGGVFIYNQNSAFARRPIYLTHFLNRMSS